MNDTYVEVMVARRKSPLVGIGRYLLYGLAVICLLLTVMAGGIFFVGAVVFAILAYFVMPMFDIEYEYLYLDKEISIDKIMSKEKRKHAYTVDFNRMEFMAPSRSHELDSYRARNVKVYDFSSGTEDAKVYSIVYSDGTDTVLVDIEPNGEMLSAIKNVFPRKVLDF